MIRSSVGTALKMILSESDFVGMIVSVGSALRASPTAIEG